MTHNIWYALPSLTAVLILSWGLFISNKISSVKGNRPVILLLVSLLAICFIEFGTYTSLLPPSLIVMKLFYAACFLGLTGIFLQSAKVSGLEWLKSKQTTNVVTSLCMLLVSLMLFTDLLISGFSFIGYSYTREAGSMYWLVQTFILSFNLLAIALLVIGTTNKNIIDSKRAKLLLGSLTPLLLFGLFLVSVMQMGFDINASIMLPLFVVYFLLVLLHTAQDESLFSLLMKLPYSKESESLKQITKEIQQFLIKTELSSNIDDPKNEVSLKTLTNSIENLIVKHAVELNQGSQVKAASLLGVSSSSICRKKRLS